jgi:hypothetical protein
MAEVEVRHKQEPTNTREGAARINTS